MLELVPANQRSTQWERRLLSGVNRPSSERKQDPPKAAFSDQSDPTAKQETLSLKHPHAAQATEPRPPARRGRGSAGTAKRMSVTILVGLLAAFVALVALVLANANFLRGPISNYVSKKLDRPFAIHGNLDIGLFRHPHVRVNDIVLGNTAWGSRATMLELKQAVISIELLPLFRGRVVLPEVRLVQPDVLLERDDAGNANWTFGKDEQTQSGKSNPPEIRSLWIEKGKVTFVDAKGRTDVKLAIDSSRGESDGASTIGFTGTGRLRNEEFELDGRAGSLLELKEAGRPYSLSVKARAGDTKASFDGTLVPLRMESIDGQVTLSGKDLSQLYPIVPVPLPWTPAYRISGHLVREGQKYALHDLEGGVGKSDIEGDVAADLTGKRTLLTMDLASKRLDYKDFTGVLGVPPPGNPRSATPAQRKEAEKREESETVLSSKPYSLERLRAVDADVKFKGESVIARDIPLDKVAFELKLKEGKLALAPLDFGLAGGHVLANIALDATKDVIETRADATVKNVEVKAFLPKLKESAGSAGKLGGRAKLATKGNSIAQMAASANGELALIMAQGRLSTLALVLTNLDLANATKYLLRGNPDAPVYCAVINASIRDGWVEPNVFVIDSSEELINGEGGVDLRAEEYKLRLVAKSKRASLVALRGPIRIGGSFKDPAIHPEVGPLALRAGAAVALGTLLTPLASLLALVDPGGAKDSNCAALIDQAVKEVSTKKVAPPKEAAPATSSTEPANGDGSKATR
jgi:AsmA family protein